LNLSSAVDVELAYIRALLDGGGPSDASGQSMLAQQATAFIRDKQRAAILAGHLALTISFHHLLAGMNGEAPGPCCEALSIVDEIEAAIQTG
jgi:hypothetical protein